MLAIDETELNLHGEELEKFQIDLACWLYEKRALTMNRSAAFCGLDWYAFMGELAQRDISIMDDKSVLDEIADRKR